MSLTHLAYIWTLFKVQFIQDSRLFRVQFKKDFTVIKSVPYIFQECYQKHKYFFAWPFFTWWLSTMSGLLVQPFNNCAPLPTATPSDELSWILPPILSLASNTVVWNVIITILYSAILSPLIFIFKAF